MPPDYDHLSRGLYGQSLLNGIVYRLSLLLLAILGRTVWRFRITGLDRLPVDEPYLLLPNHTSLLDPFWIGAKVPRGVKSMASANLFAIPVIGAYLRMVGCFPKKKYTKDKESMQDLQRFFDEGYTIMLFPEGNRSWNGETAEIQPGIGRLIKRLGCKVVYGRLSTAYLVQPRWAKYPRWVPVEMTYDGPYSYDDSQTVEEITAHVQSCLTVNPTVKSGGRTAGFRMAHGLPQYLWACPSCFALSTMTVSKRGGDWVSCTSCQAEWAVDVESMLTPSTSGPAMTVAEAFHLIDDHFGSRPVSDPARFAETGVVLHSEHGHIQRVSKGKKALTTEGEGRIELRPDGLQVVEGGAVVWSVAMEDIKSISVEMANLLHFRVDGVLYRVTVRGDSPLKWDHFLRRWQGAA